MWINCGIKKNERNLTDGNLKLKALIQNCQSFFDEGELAGEEAFEEIWLSPEGGDSSCDRSVKSWESNDVILQ